MIETHYLQAYYLKSPIWLPIEGLGTLEPQAWQLSRGFDNGSGRVHDDSPDVCRDIRAVVPLLPSRSHPVPKP